MRGIIGPELDMIPERIPAAIWNSTLGDAIHTGNQTLIMWPGAGADRLSIPDTVTYSNDYDLAGGSAVGQAFDVVEVLGRVWLTHIYIGGARTAGTTSGGYVDIKITATTDNDAIELFSFTYKQVDAAWKVTKNLAPMAIINGLKVRAEFTRVHTGASTPTFEVTASLRGMLL